VHSGLTQGYRKAPPPRICRTTHQLMIAVGGEPKSPHLRGSYHFEAPVRPSTGGGESLELIPLRLCNTHNAFDSRKLEQQESWWPSIRQSAKASLSRIPAKTLTTNSSLAQKSQPAAISHSTRSRKSSTHLRTLTYGTDLYTVSKLLGHCNIRTTQIYAKIVDEQKRKAVNLIPKL